MKVLIILIVLISNTSRSLTFAPIINTTLPSSRKCELETVHKKDESTIHENNPYNGGDYYEIFYNFGKDKVESLISIKRQSNIPCDIVIQFYNVTRQTFDFHDTVHLNSGLKCDDDNVSSWQYEPSEEGKWRACWHKELRPKFTRAHSYRIESTSGKI